MTSRAERLGDPTKAAEASTLRLPPSPMHEAIRSFKAQPVLYAVVAMCVPLAVCLLLLITMLHSATMCSVVECALAWVRFIKYRSWDSSGTLHSHDKLSALISSFHMPLLLALITLRALVMRAVGLHVPHTSARKRHVVLGLNAAYVAAIYICWHSMTQLAEASVAEATAARRGDEITPASLFLTLRRSTLYFTLLSCVSCWWTPTSDEKLRAAEHTLLRKHQASSGSAERTLDQQMRQHHAGHIAYTVLEHEQDPADVGSNAPDENEGEQPDASSSSSSTAPSSSVDSFSGTAVVFLHGYGAGKSFWFLNLPAISRDLPSARIYALDLPGMGCSAHQYTMHACRTAAHAEGYFVSALEGWRRTLGLERMILVGHSFGGLVAGCYALRYPQHVSQLILVSPVGLPVPPPIDQAAASAPAGAQRAPVPSWISRYGLHHAARWLWGRGITLSQVLHWFGPFGLPLFKLIITKRFNHLDASREKVLPSGRVSPRGVDVDSMANYLYHLNAGSCPGHRGLNLLLRPGAFAVDPLVPRLSANLAVPCAFMYGASDWMSIGAAQEVCVALTKKGIENQCVTVEHAGHQLYLENPKAFNTLIVGIIRLACARQREAMKQRGALQNDETNGAEPEELDAYADSKQEASSKPRQRNQRA